MTITLSKAETAVLVEAASRPDGLVTISLATKPTTRERMLGRLVRDGLATRTEGDEVAHHLTPAGYRAVGLRPPRKPQSGSADAGEAATPRTGTKVALIREMLGRPEGATLDELIAATGWLPHTTRAALSRVRATGQALERRERPDGSMAYHFATVKEQPSLRRARRSAAVTAHAEVIA